MASIKTRLLTIFLCTILLSSIFTLNYSPVLMVSAEESQTSSSDTTPTDTTPTDTTPQSQQNTLPQNSTSNLTPIGVTLEHSPISIGKSVNWVERIDSANTQNPVIEIPADAINVKLTDSNGDIAKFHEVSQQQVDTTTDPVVETPEDALHDNANTIYVLPVEPVQSISFVTKAPYTVESETITDNLYQKQVKVAQDSALHYTYVLSFSSIPEDLVSQGVEFKLYWMVDGKRTDVTNDQAYSVKFVDTNDNGINDQIQWTVPHLSEQNFVVQGIINATNAAHLDSNRNIISDVYEQVQSRDGIFTGEISAGDYIRVTFERELTSQNDISIYAKSSNPGATIEVYAKDSDSLIATFDEISNDTMYRILLTNLPASQDTFDLKVIGGSVDFDNIIDPSSTATQLTITAPSAEIGRAHV